MTKNFVLMMLLCSIAGAVASDIEPYLGRWALFVPDGAAWLEVKEAEGYVDADLLWYGGSVVPVDHAYLHNGSLVVTRVHRHVQEKDANGKAVRTHQRTELYTFTFYGEQLVGKQISPTNNGYGTQVTKFYGKKLPDLPPAPDLTAINYDEPISLFNGSDLTGWELMGENRENGWTVKEGVLFNNPVQKEGEPRIHYGNIKTTDKFEDFNLTLEVNVPKGSNSGIYLRGIYEVQIADTYGKDLDSHNMGAIYSRITPATAAEKPAGEWQNLDITLCDRHVTVILNGETIINNQPLMGITGGAITPCECEPGPIYLQGDHGPVSYRNVVLKPIIK